jgi:6-pyruvoyltetrahydropterin/6-carboxytetrahydropterin synthase
VLAQNRGDHRSDLAELGRSSAAPQLGLRIELGRRYRFAASHRLYTRRLSEEENARVFGKCANPFGHGHNYVLEVSLSGEVDPATGMIANLTDLDPFVEREVIEAFDHHSLNEDVAAFREVVPTTENLCIEIFRRLKSFPNAKLERVRVQETTNNSFEYAGEDGREKL